MYLRITPGTRCQCQGVKKGSRTSKTLPFPITDITQPFHVQEIHISVVTFLLAGLLLGLENEFAETVKAVKVVVDGV